jgi:hypothetical protein
VNTWSARIPAHATFPSSCSHAAVSRPMCEWTDLGRSPVSTGHPHYTGTSPAQIHHPLRPPQPRQHTNGAARNLTLVKSLLGLSCARQRKLHAAAFPTSGSPPTQQHPQGVDSPAVANTRAITQTPTEIQLRDVAGVEGGHPCGMPCENRTLLAQRVSFNALF